ncbi:MAG TPA: aminotransferase class V-fold PLP-dependent enzyme [Bryobacteraceae bacterium]|nr:aminotransferase class V-fold PLP-dependent enzyme [Bryobacteraceae bacterium]
MGYDNLIRDEPAGGASAQPLWQRYRGEFPITDRLVYLNHAAVAPLCRRAADAMKALADDALLYGAAHYDQWLAAYAGVRAAAARLIGAAPAEIAIVKNTSEGIATVAAGTSWRAGDKIVAFEDEFPANLYPWKRLEERGVKVEWLRSGAQLDRIDEAAVGARLLAVSFVGYLSGYRADIEGIGEICRRRGCFLLVDAIQGIGAFPLDVQRANIDALAADGHKWMLGPEGCGVLYVRRERQDEIEPVEFGWTNVAGYADYASRDMTLRADAGRYECGTLNTIGCFGLRAALEFVLEVGVERVAPAVQALGDAVAAGAQQRGYETLVERTPETGSGIVSIRHPSLDHRMVVRQLREQGFMTAPRQGWVRVSPHFYISPAEIDAFTAALPAR